MPLTIAPSDEACQAVVALINAGSTYTLYQTATYSRAFQDDLASPAGLIVDVVHESESPCEDSIDQEPPTSHMITVWMRDKLANVTNTAVAAKALIFRKLLRVLNVHVTGNSRVTIWDVEVNEKEVPDKEVLVTNNYFRAKIELRVEVVPA